MGWFRAELGDDVLDFEAQMGPGVDELIASGQIAVVRGRLLAWRKTIGWPGRPVGRRLGRVVGVERGVVPGVEGDGPEAALAETRTKLEATLVGVNRIYLLTNTFCLSNNWMLDDLGMAEMVRRFLSKARQYGDEHKLDVDTHFSAPIRSVGRFGWTGSASIRCTGTALELQEFVHRVCWLAFVGLEPSSIRGPFMQEIPTFKQAKAAEGYITFDDSQLLSELPGSRAAEERDRREALKESMERLQRMVEKIEGS